jgi:hypothetical protein
MAWLDNLSGVREVNTQIVHQPASIARLLQSLVSNFFFGIYSSSSLIPQYYRQLPLALTPVALNTLPIISPFYLRSVFSHSPSFKWTQPGNPTVGQDPQPKRNARPFPN